MLNFLRFSTCLYLLEEDYAEKLSMKAIFLYFRDVNI